MAKRSKKKQRRREPREGRKRTETPRAIQERQGQVEHNIEDKRYRYVAWAGAGLLLIIYAAEVIWSTWVCDDAYITFRTIDNFVNGLGLTWNPTYRVQTYTHPAWMFLNSLFYLFSRNAFFTVAVVGIVTSLLAVLVSVGVCRSPYRGAVAVLTFALSKAFVDYSTSGMENPLSHLLIGLFIFVYLVRGSTRNATLWLSILAALSMLNRLDLALVIGPAYLLHLLKERSMKCFILAAIGFSPMIIWLLFSLFYYGFAFPNTAYAKLNTGLEKAVLWEQGLAYIWSTARIDPITLAAIASGVVLPAVLTKSLRNVMLSLGILLYILYVISFGGDFMSGRFLTVPFYAAVCLICGLPNLSLRFGILTAGLALVLGISPERSPIRFSDTLTRLKDHSKIEDERAFYMRCSSFQALDGTRYLPDCRMAELGREAGEGDVTLTVKGSVGFFGYFAGPRIHIVDRFALAEPLLARLPMERYDNWRIGHFRRKLPRGYLQTLHSGENRFEDKRLGEYYEKLQLVIQGELFSGERLIEIFRFNTGEYDDLLAPE